MNEKLNVKKPPTPSEKLKVTIEREQQEILTEFEKAFENLTNAVSLGADEKLIRKEAYNNENTSILPETFKELPEKRVENEEEKYIIFTILSESTGAIIQRKYDYGIKPAKWSIVSPLN